MRQSAGYFDHQVLFHHEVGDWGESWWAECVDLPGFTAAADTEDELRQMVDAFMREHLGAEVRWYSYRQEVTA